MQKVAGKRGKRTQPRPASVKERLPWMLSSLTLSMLFSSRHFQSCKGMSLGETNPRIEGGAGWENGEGRKGRGHHITLKGPGCESFLALKDFSLASQVPPVQDDADNKNLAPRAQRPRKQKSSWGELSSYVLAKCCLRPSADPGSRHQSPGSKRPEAEVQIRHQITPEYCG